MWKKYLHTFRHFRQRLHTSSRLSQVLGIHLDHHQLTSIVFDPHQQHTLHFAQEHLKIPETFLENLQTLACHTLPIAMSLPNSAFTLKKIMLSSEKKTYQKIKMLLLNYLNELKMRSTESFYFDYQVCQTKEERFLLIVSIAAEKIKSLQSQLQAKKLKLAFLEPESHAIERFFCFFYPELQDNIEEHATLSKNSALLDPLKILLPDSLQIDIRSILIATGLSLYRP